MERKNGLGIFAVVLVVMLAMVSGFFVGRGSYQDRDLRAYDDKVRLDSLTVRADVAVQQYKGVMDAFEANISTGKPIYYKSTATKKTYEINLVEAGKQ